MNAYKPRRAVQIFLIPTILALFLACAVNPVTGKKEFMLLSEQGELQLGQETDKQIAEIYGIYEDPQLTAYVTRIGERLGKHTHRSNVTYKFKVLDSPVVNAFAVPGGYVYVTRGILAYFNNEAELAGVLGHELGHVNARHTARAYSRAVAASLGLGVGSALSEDFAKVAPYLEFGVSMLFLKFSRSDEHQADALGVEYASKGRYDAHQMAVFFETLERLNPGSDMKGLPGWFSTHPNPEDRIKAINTQTVEWQKKLALTNPSVNRNDYLQQIDGIVFGEDPRQGYVSGNAFYHPGLKFTFPVPSNWKIINTPAQVQTFSPEENAAVILTLAQGESPEDASKRFLTDTQAKPLSSETLTINGLWTQKVVADITSGETELRVASYFIQKGERIYAFHGLATLDDYPKYRPIFANTIENFKNLTDPARLNVVPERLVLRRTTARGTLRDAFRRFGVPADKLEALAILNGMNLDETLQPGTSIKIVD